MLPHDPFQNFQTLGAYSGGAPQFGLPITAFQPPIQPSFNPAGFWGQPQTVPSNAGYLTFPQPGIQQALQAAGIPTQQGPLQQILALNPLANILQNPLLAQQLAHHQLAQNPLTQQQFVQQSPWQQNPTLAAGLQNALLNPMLAYYGWQQLQQQQQPQLNYSLAPQSMIGAGGIGQQQPFGSQIHPLQALAALQGAYRPATGYGILSGVGGF